MNLSLHIARRYLFAKKSHNAINVISMISVCGIAVATMALVCALSVFNGFTQVVATTFSAFDPELQITPAQGKVFDAADAAVKQLDRIDGIDFTSQSLEENALLKYGDSQQPIILKGVSSRFVDLANVRKLIIDGDFILREGDVDNAVIGAGLAMTLGVRANFLSPVEIYIPKRNVRINMANPSTAFTQSQAYIGGVFALNQEKYDTQMMLISIDQMRELLDYSSEVSSIDVKLKPGADTGKVKGEIKKLLGNGYEVKDRFEQQADMYRMVNVEKWVTFLILAIILVIAVFNVVGSLSMLILEKKDDIKILQNLGAGNNLIARIFMIEGWLITFVGAIAGMILGVAVCLAQQYLGLLKLGDPGAFAVDAYPVQVEPMDVVVIFLTVCLFGVLAVLYPVTNMKKKLL